MNYRIERRNLIILGLAAVCLVAAEAPSFDTDRYLAHIKYLASPEMKGRASGSPELRTDGVRDVREGQ